MKSVAMKALCRILILALLSITFQGASAGIIGTGQAAAAADRAVVLTALNRSDVSSQLQAQGLDPSVARDRIAAMSDQEVHALAGGIATAPAGADVGWGAIILVGLIVWFVWYRK